MEIQPTDKIFKQACVRTAKHFGIDGIKTYDDIPAELRDFFVIAGYKVVVTPTVLMDKARGNSIGMIAIKYRLSRMQVKYILGKHG